MERDEKTSGSPLVEVRGLALSEYDIALLCDVARAVYDNSTTLAALLAIVNDTLPPTINLDNPDEGMDLNFVPHTPQKRKTDFAINNSFGFGGHNTSLIFGRFQG